MRCLSLASSFLAIMAIDSQAGPAAASSMRLGRQPAADDRTLPETQPSGGRPQASLQSKAVTVRALSLEDRLDPERGLGSVDADESFLQRQRKLDEICPQGFVKCVNGQAHDESGSLGRSCEDECGNQCCSGGSNVCTSFTGYVCKDGSCNGPVACEEARLSGSPPERGFITGASCRGHEACRKLGRNGGSVHSVSGGSCTDTMACSPLADHSGNSVGPIIGSCKGYQACHHSINYGAHVGHITNSCNGNSPCRESFRPATINDGITNSCHGYYACALMGGVITAFHNCCQTGTSCNSDNGDADLPDQCAAPPPTTSPTLGPTTSPTPSAPWDIDFQEMAATFATDIEEDIKFVYLIGSGRDYEMSLLKKGCDAEDSVDDALYNVTSSTTVVNATHQWLNVTYSLDKSALTSSSIWNNGTSTIELCQVTSLFEIADEPIGKLVIAQDKREVSVYVNTGVNFTIQTNLTGAEIFNETEELDVAGSVTAFKCSEDDFSENNDKLNPNDEMFTCVGSNNAAFEVETLDSMAISQTGKLDMQVIVGGVIQIPAITSREYTTEGVKVGTRVPKNLFDFFDGAFLTISGALTMKLADGSSRRLNVELGSMVRNLQDETNEASYTADVALQTAEDSPIQDLMNNSAASVAAAAIKGFIIAAFFLLL